MMRPCRASSGTPPGRFGSGWSPSTLGVLAEVTVSRYVARRRVELGLDRVQVAVPQTHPPGAEALCGVSHASPIGRPEICGVRSVQAPVGSPFRSVESA